ncbi:MAG: MFS transporter [Candidatus Bathyarchaeia archaeon]|nr:MFS transporter [Candidatus Bathyarchaeota archaeon]
MKKRNINWIIYIFTAFFSFGYGVTIPVVPLYAKSLEASYFIIGLIGAAYGFSYTLSAAPLGRLSDKIGRNKMLSLSASLAASSSILYTLSQSAFQLIFIKVLEGISWAAFFPSVEAAVTEKEEKSGKAMGVCATLYGVGFALASIFGGVLVDYFGYKLPFLVYFIFSLASLGLTVFIPSTLTKLSVSSNELFEKDFKLTLKIALSISFGYSFILAIILYFFPVYGKALNLSATIIGFFLTVFWIARIISFIFLGSLSDKLGRKNILLFTLSLSMAASSGIIYAQEKVALIFMGFTLGLGLGAPFPVTIALISDKTSPNRKGMAMGLFETASAAGQAFSPFIGGLASEFLSLNAPFLLCSFIAFSCVLVSLKIK